MIQEFRDVFANRYKVVRERENQEQKVAGWVCTYVPEEILYAAGMLPIRVVGAAGDTSTADAYLYSNVCSLARGCLEEGFRSHYDFLDGYVSVNTCDNIRRLYDVWSRYLNTPFVHLIKLPHKITEASIAYFKDELIHLKRRLEEFTGKGITDEALHQAIEVYNKMRSLLRRLYELRKGDSPPISGAETLDVVLAAMLMPKDQYNQRLEDLLEDISKQERTDGGKPRLMIIGSELDDSEYIKIIEDLGALVVTDDLCNGTRYFWDLVESDGEPMEALARRYLTRSPCARMRPGIERHNHIKEVIKEYRIDGIIYEIIKFCDIYGEDYPLFRDRLKELDVPILTLSREYSMAGVGQLRTRVQAFLESIGG